MVWRAGRAKPVEVRSNARSGLRWGCFIGSPIVLGCLVAAFRGGEGQDLTFCRNSSVASPVVQELGFSLAIEHIAVLDDAMEPHSGLARDKALEVLLGKKLIQRSVVEHMASRRDHGRKEHPDWLGDVPIGNTYDAPDGHLLSRGLTKVLIVSAGSTRSVTEKLRTSIASTKT
jgi:hypothetical protein